MDKYNEILTLVESGTRIWDAIRSVGIEHPRTYYNSLPEQQRIELRDYGIINGNGVPKGFYIGDYSLFEELNEFFTNEDKEYE